MNFKTFGTGNQCQYWVSTNFILHMIIGLIGQNTSSLTKATSSTVLMPPFSVNVKSGKSRKRA